MATIYESMMVASVLVGLMSIPVASQSVDTQSDISSDLNSVSIDESVPEEVVEETSSDEFYRSVNTAFDRFTTRIRPGSSEIVLEDAGVRLEIEETPEKTVWTLSSSQGEMKKIESPEKSKEIYEMPEGTLEKAKTDGGVSQRFDGADRQEVESKAEKLEELMDQKLEELEQRQSEMEEDLKPELSIEVDPVDEQVEIENIDSREVDLSGWEVHESGQHYYEFEDLTLQQGQEIILYTEEGENTEKELYWGYSEEYSIWSQEGDTATLYNEEEEIVAQKSY